VVPIVYGLPSYEAHLEEVARKIAIGGCVTSESGIDARWKCLNCKLRIFKKRPSKSRRKNQFLLIKKGGSLKQKVYVNMYGIKN
jgi:hypothetical protein